MSHGPKIGAAAWQFGVSAKSAHPDGVSRYIEFALQGKYLPDFSNGIGLIPPTPESGVITVNYKASGPMDVFYDMTRAQALIRPVTPGCIVQAKVFERSLGVRHLDPETDAAGAVVLDDQGQPKLPELHKITPKNPDYPQYGGTREWFSWVSGHGRTYVLATDFVFIKVIVNTFIFVLALAPLQGCLALGLA